ncbi:MAG: APC family permease [Fimbriimonadaceae bacterium]
MGWFGRIKRVLIGQPIHTKHAHHERLPKIFGLPVFASDALSSVAYATEEVMRVLLLAGVAYLTGIVNISVAIVVLIIVVASSYYQTIHAYPKGGGSYRVSTENLGPLAGQIAGASLLIDYVLTVAVSVSSGVLAIVSMMPSSQPYVVEMGVAAIAIVGVLNLRGAKESGIVFAIPTYSFVVLILVLIGYGIFRGIGEPMIAPKVFVASESLEPFGVFLILRAFAAGCTALTGVEAISDGVQAFKPPEAKNAAQTLVIMAAILAVLFLGTSWLAQHYGIVPMPLESGQFKTVVAQISSQIFGEGVFFYALQVATALILILAANTAFADFPRLSSFIARDGYLPRQLTSVGDRLVFQNGIVLLSILAIVLIVFFRGDTHALIPLYAVGVFTSFTLSQGGMAVRLWKQRSYKMIVSAVGCVITFVVTCIILVTKFTQGAWLIVVALGLCLLVFRLIKRHYDYLAEALSVDEDDKLIPMSTTTLLLVPRMHKGLLHAISYAQSTTQDVRGLHVTLDKASAEQIKKDWDAFGVDMPLVILESPYRSLVEPVIDYIDETIAENPDSMVTVIVPQAVPKYPWQALLHTNAAVPLKLALRSRKNVVITNVRYFLT